MDLLEYQSKMALKKFGLQFGHFGLANDIDQAAYIANKLQLKKAAVIPQVHRANPIYFADDIQDILDTSQKMFKKYTSPVLIQPVKQTLAKYYLAIIHHPVEREPILLMSYAKNGMRDLFDNVHMTRLDQFEIKGKEFSKIVNFLYLQPTHRKPLKQILQRLVDAYFQLDCNYLEVGTLAALQDGFELMDLKIGINESRLANQEELVALNTSLSQQIATENGLEYIPQHGSVGFIGNGKGFLISMIDAMKKRPSHLLDLKEIDPQKAMRLALEISFKNPALREFFFAIFGLKYSCKEYLNAFLELKEDWNIDLPSSFYFLGKDASAAVDHASKLGMKVWKPEEMES